MKIDFTRVGLESPDRGKTARAEQAEVAAVSGRRSAASPDQASLSFDQARIQSLESQVLSQPAIRAAKVRVLQQAIENGRYSVPSEKVADALIQEWGAAQGLRTGPADRSAG